MKDQSRHVRVVWADEIPAEQWQIYREVIDRAHKERIPFALAGAFALSAYTHHWRNTKDLDLCVLPRDRQRMIEVVTGLGLTDYYDQKPYDRNWIFRGISAGVIVDIIWAMANQRGQVDESWFGDGCVDARGVQMRVLSPEVILWDKLYILQRDRSDWPDVFNLLEAVGGRLDWRDVLRRMGEDIDLLAGALSVFRWISPRAACAIPPFVWRRVGIRTPMQDAGPPCRADHIRLLDSRPWFFPGVQCAEEAA